MRLRSMVYRCFRHLIELLEHAAELKSAALTFCLAGALLFTSCGTPGTRISQHPDVYQRLSSQDQALVSQGQIRLGMSMDAVWLAWGTPEQKIPGYGRGRPTETWVYLRYDTPPSYGGPYYYGPFDWSYIPPKFPYPSKGVTFASGRVVFFRHLPAPPPVGW
jgi:hypothetical protein